MSFRDFFEYEVKRIIDFLLSLLSKSELTLSEILASPDTHEFLSGIQNKFENNPEAFERFLTSAEVENHHKAFAKYCYKIALKFNEKDKNLSIFYANLGKKVEEIGNHIFTFGEDTQILQELTELKQSLKQVHLL